MIPGRPLLIAAGAALATATVGGAMTRIDAWYTGLEKSLLNPPDWAFAPGWTIIFALAALAATIGWRDAKTQQDRFLLVIFFFNVGQQNILEGFSFAMIVGVVVGTYSSIYVASPLLLLEQAGAPERPFPATMAIVAFPFWTFSEISMNSTM